LKVEHNISRLKYLLDLYDITVEGLSKKISAGFSKTSKAASVFFRKNKFNSELNVGALITILCSHGFILAQCSILFI
jgi:hypothetical protein